MDIEQLSLDLVNTSDAHNMGIELWLDECKFFDSTVSPGTHHVLHEFSTDEQEHSFRIILKNKNHSNTQVDHAGNILKDSLIDIKNIQIAGINLDYLVTTKSTYCHDNNGQSTLTEHKFYGHLGCNGTVEFKFSSPIYLWLLENM